MEAKKKGGSCMPRDMVSWDVGISRQLLRLEGGHRNISCVLVVLTNGLLFQLVTLVDSKRVR